MAEFAQVVLNLPIDRAFTYRIPEGLRARVRPGVRVRVPFRNLQEMGYVAGLAERTEVPHVKDILDADPEVTADPRILELTRWIAGRYGCSWGEALEAAIPTGVKKARPGKFVRLVSAGDVPATTPKRARVQEFARLLESPLDTRHFAARAGTTPATVWAMVREGSLRQTRVRSEVDAMADAIVEKPKDIRLTPEQEEALRTIEGGGVVLLHGVTGSGKTEVYLRAIGRVVAAGRQAIVLVPEIALTPQTVSRFKARFRRVAVLHSVLSDADRAGQWRAIRAGEVDVVVGARSAIFAPTPALGLVVVDEEHEAAYKQDADPRYHAREVAVKRGELEGAAVVLGTATPSLESYYLATAGRYRLARLPSRIERREMPEIEVVDMTAEKAELGRGTFLSRRMEQLVREALGRGEQVILFLNRRGFLTHVSCPRCKWFFHCDRCDVAMTYHKEGNQAVCHYCMEARPLPAACPACGHPRLVQYGMGTERIEAEVRRLFPGRAVTRMDSDSMKTRQNYRESLGAFWSGKTDILVGTQMIAKGLDVPDVTLVGVVNADTAFHIPDFRAAERTFQIITQVAGRTGRGPRGGRVVVQTYYPQHYAVKAASTYDFSGFVRRELEMRQEAGYPPFASLVRFVVQGFKEDRVAAAAERLGQKLRAALAEPEAKVLGPAVAPLYKLKGRYRVHLLVKAPSLEAVMPRLKTLAGSLSGDRALQLVMDVDPTTLL